MFALLDPRTGPPYHKRGDAGSEGSSARDSIFPLATQRAYLLDATVSSGPSVIAEPCDGKRRPAGLAHNLADARSGPANRAYVSGDGTAARSRTPSATHTRMNNGSHVCAA